MSDSIESSLRAEIASLRAQLQQATDRDTRRSEIEAALAAAGVPSEALPDAASLFLGAAKLNQDGTWYLQTGGSTLLAASTQRAIQRWLQSRPHFTQSEATADVPDAWPKDAAGKPIDVNDLTSDELFELAGEFPTASAAIQRDTHENRAADLNQAVQSDRRYTPQELDAMSTDELWQAAGEFPRG
jgi:hypothetical protein